MTQTKTWKSNCFPSLHSHIFVLSVAQNCPKTVSLYVFPDYIIVSIKRLNLAPSLSFWKQRILPTILLPPPKLVLHASIVSTVILLNILCWLPTTLSMTSGHLSMAFKVLPYLSLQPHPLCSVLSALSAMAILIAFSSLNKQCSHGLTFRRKFSWLGMSFSVLLFIF